MPEGSLSSKYHGQSRQSASEGVRISHSMPKSTNNHDPATSASRNGCHILSEEVLKGLGQFDTCTIANAIERCGVRLRNEGFTLPGLQCLTPPAPPLVGYAATCRVRSSDPPLTGNVYLDRTDWWQAIERLPSPRVAVIQDLEPDAYGSVVGEVHCAILEAFHCLGVITNGAVRDIPAVSRMAFSMFARYAAVSHSYTHVVDYGDEAEIFGLKVRSGDLVMADCHGAVLIPIEIAEELSRVAAEIRAGERRIIDICRSPDFSPEKLLDVIQANH